jgi:hypothetical protein
VIPEQPASGYPPEQEQEPVPVGTPAGHPVCATCGTVAASASPPTWSLSTEAGRRVWTCERCAREHLRSIEAKLDSAWW